MVFISSERVRLKIMGSASNAIFDAIESFCFFLHIIMFGANPVKIHDWGNASNCWPL